MRHDIGFFDNGKYLRDYGGVSRRNDGQIFAMFCIAAALAFIAMFLVPIGLFDSEASITVAYVGYGLLASAGSVLGLIGTHRNVGLKPSAVRVMDAIYLLPKTERKKYNITKNDLNALTSYDADTLVHNLDEYRRNRMTESGLGKLQVDVIEYNKTVKEIEAHG